MKLFGTAIFLYYLQATSSVPFFTLVEILGDEFELETFHFGSNCSKLKKTLQQLCPCSFSDAVCDNFKCYFALEQLLEEILIYKPFLKKVSICKDSRIRSLPNVFDGTIYESCFHYSNCEFVDIKPT